MPDDEEKQQDNNVDVVVADFLENLRSMGVPVKDVRIDLEDNKPRFLPKPKRITKLSERLNDWQWDFEMYTDTTQLVPGLVIYVIDTIAPTDKRPYVTYRPSPRVIAEIRDSGVNNGTSFFVYNHNVVQKPEFKTLHKFNVVSELEIVYSPLTKGHAAYLCKLFNFQSRKTYLEYAKQMKERRK